MLDYTARDWIPATIMRVLRSAMAWFFLLALVACGGEGNSAPLDKDAFVRAFVERVHERFADARVDVRNPDRDDISVVLTWADAAEFAWYPDNAYQQYLGDPAQLDAILQRHLGSLAALRSDKPGKESSIEPARVLPVVKNKDWFDGVDKLTRKDTKDASALEDSRPLRRPLVDDLYIAYVEDGDSGMRFLSRSDLAALGMVDVDVLDALALANLEKRLGEVRVVGHDGRYRLQLDTNYDASLVLLIDRLRDRLAVDGDPVIAIAARDSVMVCGSNDRESVASLRRQAGDIARDSPYGLTGALHTLRDGKLVSF